VFYACAFYAAGECRGAFSSLTSIESLLSLLSFVSLYWYCSSLEWSWF
jgi:hypothetical protein